MKKEHNRGHDHGSMPIILYIVGVILFIIAEFFSAGITKNILFTISVVTAGYHVIGEGFADTYNRTKANKKFTPNIHLLMALAAIGAMLINNFQEGALLIIIFAGAHFLEEYAEGRSKREITNLLNLNPTEARLILDDGTTKTVAVNELNIGDRLQVNIGDQIATDGIVVEGKSSIDESSITGESIPKEISIGDTVFGSTINGNGSFIMEVTKDPSETVFAKILELVDQSQSNLSKTATKIKSLEPKYVTLVLILFPFYVLAGNYLLNWGWDLAFYRGMVFLTVTSPCALAASAVPATLSAISNLARHGVLFKGGSFASNLAGINAVAFDKTGTLTQGKPVVTDVVFKKDITEDQIVLYTDIIIAMEKQANHPLGNAILNHFNMTQEITFDVENIIGTGIVAHHEGVNYRIGKPSSFTHVEESLKILTDEHAEEGKTVVYFGTEDEVLVLISMMDIASNSAVDVIKYLNDQNIQTVMITGDAKKTAEAVARNIGITHVRSEVHPEDKVNIIAKLQKDYGMVAMLGDGINDAPALVNADIGIAMGDGTDIAIDVADAVLMQNDMKNFAYAHKVSKRLDKIVWQNIYFSMGVVVFLVILNSIGQMNLPLGVLFHEGSTIVVILNGLRLLKNTKD